MVVRDIIEEAGLQPVSVTLGDVELKQAPSESQLERVNERLSEVGFEILTDQKKRTVEKIKNAIVQYIQSEDLDDEHNFSELLSSSLNKDYSYLSKLFSEAEGITIEKYIIDQKIERVKELLAYGELTLSEMSYKLGYSSVAHLSSQFKKVTGFNPSEFRKLKNHHRKPLDEI
jgi:AraC-like DNA-binding protein